MTADYAKSYVDWDYYNFAGLTTGEEWTFQVVPVKKMKDNQYKTVGERSAALTVAVKGKTGSVDEALGPVTLTGQGVAGGVEMKWNELPGMGTKFDRYGLIWQEGFAESLSGSVARGAVLQNYYNLTGLKNDTYYTFQVVPVKVANGNFTEVGHRSKVVQVKTLGATASVAIPTITQPEQNSVLTNFPRYAFLVWTPVASVDRYEIELACDVCVSTSEKWLKPTIYKSRFDRFTTPALAGDNEFRFRVKAFDMSGKSGEWSDYRYFSYKTKSEPKVESESIQTVSLDYRYLGKKGSFVLKVNSPNFKGIGYNFHEDKYASLGDGAFYVSSSEGTVKFWANNIGQGGLIRMGNVDIDSVQAPTDKSQYYRFGVVVDLNQTYAVYDEKHNTFALMRVTGVSSGIATPVQETDSISLAITGWTNGLPAIKWTEYKGQPFDGYAVFVRKGTWDKDQVTWADPFYFSKDVTSYQLVKMLPNTDYTVRIVAYAQTVTGKQMLYPASNVLSFKTQVENTTVAVDKSVSCGNSAGDDGLYSACKGDSIDHDLSGLTATVLKYNSRYVKLALDSADKKVIVVRMGKTKTVLADTDMRVTFKYTEMSGNLAHLSK